LLVVRNAWGAWDVTKNEAVIAAVEKRWGLVYIMRIAVMGSMGQVATGGAEFDAFACRAQRREPHIAATVKALFDAKYGWSDGLIVELTPA
jgi:hypothetical protein